MYPPLLLAALLLAVFACDSDPRRSCDAVTGGVTGLSLPVFEGEALVGFRVEGAAVSGDLPGTSTADFHIASAADDGTLHLTGSHTFLDAEGAVRFRTDDEGTTTAEGRVENRMTLVEGATGTLTTTGAVDLETGALTLRYEGEVCP